jgi:hypothetical protein
LRFALSKACFVHWGSLSMPILGAQGSMSH